MRLGIETPCAFIPCDPEAGHEAEVDWGAATAIISGDEVRLKFFCMRSQSSGKPFVRMYPCERRQAFFDAHARAFAFFGGVFLARIEVVNLDKWVSDFLKRNGYSYQIDYGPRIMPLWEAALSLAPSVSGLDAAFYREEWERVVQPAAASTANEYLKVPRLGRGVRLSRKGPAGGVAGL